MSAPAEHPDLVVPDRSFPWTGSLSQLAEGVNLGPGAPVPWSFPHDPALPHGEYGRSVADADRFGEERLPGELPVAPFRDRSHPWWREHVGFGVLLGLFAGLLSWHIGSFGLWRDEAFSVSTSVRSWGSLAHLSVTRETNGVLYALLLKLWSGLGTGEAVLRRFSALAMLVAVTLLYVLTRRLAQHLGSNKRNAGCIAVAVTVLNGTMLEYGQEIRFYALMCVAVLAAMLAFESEVRSPSAKHRRMWTLTLMCVPLVHLMAVVVVPAQLLTLFALPPSHRRWRQRLRALIPVAAVTAPIAVLISSRDEGQSLINFGPRVAGELVQTLSGRAGALGAVAVALIGTLVCIAAWQQRPGAGPQSRGPDAIALCPWVFALILAWAIVPVAVLAAGSLVRPILTGRYLVHLIPAMGLGAGIAIESLRSNANSSRPGGRTGPLVLALAAIVIGVSGVVGAGGWLRHDLVDDWRGVARTVFQQARPDDGIVFANDSVRLYFEYYRTHPTMRQVESGPVPLFPPGPWGAFGTGDHEYRPFTQAEIRSYEGRVARLWVVVESPLRDRVAALTDLRARHCRVGRWILGSAAVVELYDFSRAVLTSEWDGRGPPPICRNAV